MKWMGLTGGIASGKSTVSRLLRAHGLPVLDADELAREVVQKGTPGHDAVIALFGKEAVSDSGELDRKRIGEIVFSDRSKLQALENIIHPKVRELTEKRRQELADAGHKIAFYDVPLLFEKNMQSIFDRVVVVTCAPETQLKRLMERDHLSHEEAKRRLAAQLPLSEKTGLADDVIHNDDDLKALESKVKSLISRLSK